MTSKLAALSALAPPSSHSIPTSPCVTIFPVMPSDNSRFRGGGVCSGFARCHASKDSRTSEGEREEGESCLFARRRSGRLSRRGELSTESDIVESISPSPHSCKRGDLLTKDLPCLTQPSLIHCIENENHSMAFIVVSGPNGSNISLTT